MAGGAGSGPAVRAGEPPGTGVRGLDWIPAPPRPRARAPRGRVHRPKSDPKLQGGLHPQGPCLARGSPDPGRITGHPAPASALPDHGLFMVIPPGVRVNAPARGPPPLPGGTRRCSPRPGVGDWGRQCGRSAFLRCTLPAGRVSYADALTLGGTATLPARTKTCLPYVRGRPRTHTHPDSGPPAA